MNARLQEEEENPRARGFLCNVKTAVCVTICGQDVRAFLKKVS